MNKRIRFDYVNAREYNSKFFVVIEAELTVAHVRILDWLISLCLKYFLYLLMLFIFFFMLHAASLFLYE